MSLARSIWGLVSVLTLGSVSVSAQAVCGTPGKDGPGGTLAGIVNTYYPGQTATASGASAITLGTATGAIATITPGDLLLIIQMQDAAINSGNNSGYGAGTTTGSGSTNLNNSGRYEYVTATNSVGAGGGSLTFRGTGAGNGLLNTYANAAATVTQGQRRYQVVRVPQYSQATLGSSLTAGFWNGTSGGILAIDVAGQLTLGGPVSVDGRGFRGGAGLGLAGGAGGSSADYVNLSSNPFHGMKGEGVAGTPRWVIDPRTNTNLDLGLEGYPAGDAARGAPATAGGGGTDGNPTLNDQNSGGGGGSNGGAGGQGGFSWSSALDVGGIGGTAFLVGAANRVVLGGGGGAGSRNNSAAPENGGGAGGGMVLIRAGTVTGVGTITANGLAGNVPANDGAGGGGAGGSVVVLTTNDGLGGLTVQARGGRGGDAWIAQAGAGSAHGPGGGGGGGTVILSGATTVDVAGGVRGSTTTGLLPFGATNGGGGRSLIAAIGASPGTSAGVLCVPALTVTKTTTTATVTNGPAGTTATYRIVAANAATRDTARSVFLLDTLPAGFIYASSSAPVFTGGASRPTTADPAAGAPIPQWTAFSIPAGGSVSQTFVVTVASSVPNGTYNNPARAIYFDPARATPTGTTSAAYNPAGAGENVTVRGPDLTVTKTHTGSFTVGVNGVYTIRVRNSGNVASSGTVTVTDTLPTGLTFVSGTGTAWTCGVAGQIVTCTRPNAINAGANAPNITLTVSVGVAAAPSVTNGVTALGGGEPTGNQANNTATDPTTVNLPPANVATTKTGPGSAAAGANVVYTISTTNAGPNAAVNVVISDTLPAGATFGSASNGGTLAGNVVTWPTIASLASGAPAVVRTVTVSYAAAGSYQNLAASQAASADPTPANNNGSAAGARATTVVSAAADVSIAKTGPATAPAATNVGYTLTVSNAGPSAATNVVVTDTLPAGATFVAATGGGTLAGNVVTWPLIASLAVGAPVSFTVTLSFAAGGSFTNVAAATSSSTDPSLANNRTTAVTAVATTADVVMTKSGPVSVAAGANAVYTVTATNIGPDAATAVVITDTLPGGATFVSATGGGTVSGSVVTWPVVASIVNGANASFSVTVTFAAAGSYLNLAASTAATPDPAAANNNGSAGPARVTTTVTPSAEVAVTNVGPATATAGTNVAYTITATNNGPSAATNVVVTDTLPAGATFVSASGGGTLAGNVVTWPVIASLASGAPSSYTLTLSYPASGTYPNAAAATSGSPDPNLTNNRAVATTTVGTSADVVTTKTGPAGVAAGVNATYSITVQNNGPSAAATVVVTDTLPAGATFVSATGSGTALGNIVTWPAVASIANGATVNFSVTVTFGVAGSYLNLAASDAATPDPVLANNNGSAAGARVTTTVTPSADVGITNVGPASATAGTNVSYTITVSNSGPSAAANVVVTDTLPAGATFVSASGGGILSGNVVTWPAIASLATGAPTAYTLTLTYPAAGSFAAAAAAASTTADPNLANNRAPATTVVGVSADVVTTKTGPAGVAAGVAAVYAITTVNNGPSTATGVVVSDTLPPGAMFVSATGGGVLAGNVVTWPAVPSIAPGATVGFTVTVTYPATGSYLNLAASAAATPDPTPANNNGSASGAQVTTTVTPAAELAVTNSGPATATAGTNAASTITATNNGPTAATNVIVTDTLPAGATFVSASGGGTLSGNVVTWPTIPSLGSGASAGYTLTLTYPAAGNYTNVAAGTSSTPDPNLANNRAPATTAVGTSADIVTAKTGPASVAAGSNAAYVITAVNTGPSAAANVIVTDTLPVGAAFVSATAGGTLAGSVVTWPAVASIANGATASFSVTVTFAATGSYLNLAASTATTPDPVPANNDGSPGGARVTTTVTPAADVAVTNVGPATATAGTNVTYTITATNGGPSPAVNVVITDTLPAGATFVSASGGGTLSGNVVTWPAIPNLATGIPTVYTMVLTYAAAGNYPNVAAAGSATPDPNQANNSALATTAVGTSADVVTTKTGPATVAAGINTTFTLTALNNGPSAAATVIVIDTLPAGATFVSASGGGTASGNVVTWPAAGSIASGGTVSFTVTVSFATAGVYQNLAASTAATPDPTPANNNGSAPGARVTTTVTASADVAVTNLGPVTATAGTNVAYTITATNNGPSPAANVVVTDTLPAGATFVSASGAGILAGNVVTWPALASLAPLASTNYTLTLTYAAAGSYSNLAAVGSTTSDPNLANNGATATTSVGASGDIVTTKTGPATVVAGGTATYTITALNNGPSSATNVVVTDTLPAGAAFVSTTLGGVVAGNVVTWPAVASIANGLTASFDVTVTFAAGGSYQNIAASTSPTPDPTPANNNGSAGGARVTTSVTPSADLAVTNVGPALVTAGAPAVYTITATNNGPSTAIGVVVTDTLPAGATFVGATGGGTLSGNVVTWPAIGTLASGASTVFTMTVTYAAAGSYSNAAAVGSPTPDPNLTNNRAPATTTVDASADVVTTKTGPATASAGQNITYTITTLNSGPSAAVNVVVTDTLPAGLAFVSASNGGILTGNVVSWPAIASLAAAASQTYTVVIQAASGGTYTNVVASTATTPDPTPANNNGSAPGSRVTTVVAASADVITTKSGPATVAAGQDITYLITTTNNGPSTATGVVVTDTLPAGLTFVSATNGGILSGAVVTWPVIGSLAPSASQGYTVVARTGVAGTYTNIAASTATTADPTPANNNGSAPGARAATVVTAVADVAVTKTGPATATAGLDFSYAITVSSVGPSAAVNVVVVDTLPAGLVFVSASGGGTLSSGVVTFPAIASLASGGSAPYTVTVRATSTGTYTNRAAGSSPTADPDPTNNDGTLPAARVSTLVGASADVATTKTGPATATAGQDIPFTITTVNTGPSTATNVVIADTLPAGLTFVSASNGGTLSGNVVTWPAVPSLANGASVSFTLTTRAANGGGYTNLAASTATTPDPVLSNNNGSAPGAQATVPVVALADVATTKSGPATGIVGQPLTFTIVTTNNGPSGAVNVVVTDTLPAGLAFVSASGGGTLAGNVVTWPAIGSLAAAASQSFAVVARPTAVGTFVNIAANSSTTADPTPANNNGSAPAARATVDVAPSADVVTTKTGPAAVTIAQDIVYTVSMTNNGPNPAATVVVTDTLPAGLNFVSASGGGTASGNVVTWPTIGPIANGATVTLTVTARAGSTGTFVNRVASQSATFDPDAGNNDGSAPASQVSTVVGPSADLVTTKTGPAAATAGLDINYTITTLNNGPSAATGVVISDTLPAGLTFVSASNSGTFASGVVTWPALASLANGATVSYTVVARASNGGSYVNLAASAATTPDPAPGDNDGSAPNAQTTTVVTGSADVVTTKTGPATATAGQDVVYTLTALNNGPSTAFDVIVTDTLPAGATVVSASNGGVLSGSVVTWPAVPTLVNGASVVFTLTVRYTAAAGYLDIAASTSTTADPVPANNNGSAAPARVVTVIGASADVVTIKTGPGAAAAGQDVPYTISTTNNGPSTAVNVVVTDTLPAGAVFVSATAGGTLAGNVITWPAIASLTSGATVTYGAVVKYLVPGNYLNLAASSSPTPDPVPANNDGSPPSGRVNTAIGPSADVVTTKTGPATANAGQDIPYTIMVTNNGPTPATDVVVTDTLPAGFAFITASAGGTLTGNVVTWPALASLANGASATFTIVARATTAGSFLNRAATTATSPDPDLSNNDGSQPAAQVTTGVGLLADVVTTKTGPATAAVSQHFSYVITVQNNGPSVAANVVVTDTLPAGLTFVNATAGGTLAGNVVTWPSIPSLAAGLPVSFTVTVRANAGGSYTNLAASGSTTPDPTPANNNGQAPAARVLTVVSSTADLRVTKTGPAVTTVGQDIGYTITVFNDGPATASSVVVTDTLPASATFVASTGGGILVGNVVTWPALASLPAGASVSYTVTLRAAAIGSITNVAAAVSPAPDPTPANNRATATTTVTAGALSADLITTKSGPATAAAGGAVVYTIQTINAGPSAAADVVITDTLPAGVIFVSATGNPTRSGNILSWPIIPSLANGASVIFTVTLQAPASGSFTNLAASTSPTPDPNPANNNGSATTSRVVTTIAATADLVTTKTGPATAGVGGQITYTIGTRNAGPDAAANVVVTDSLPAGALFVGASNGGVFANGVVTWPALASLPNGATLTYTLTLVIPNVSQVVNVARSTSTTADPIPGNNRGTATTTIAASADVVTTKTGPSRVDAGATITYTITSKNLGPQAAVGVTVIDSLPAAVTFESATDGGSLTGRVVTWPVIPTLAVGDSVFYTVVVTAPNAAAQLKNIVASTAATEDPNPGNNNSTGPGGIVITDVAPIDLAVAKAHTGDFIPGAIATYTVTVTNVGPVPTIGPVTMTDTLPAGLTYRSFTGAGWSCSNLGRVVTCRFDTVPFATGATTTVTLKVLVGGTAANTVVNRVVISTPGDTDESGNNVATDSAPLQRVSPLVIEKVASRAEAEVGDVIDYTVIVTNRTASEVPDVSVTDILPRGFTYQRSTARIDLIPIADPAGAPGPKLTFAAGNLGPNASFRLTYRVKLGAGATLGDGANRAQAKSGTGLESPVAIAVVRVTRGVFTDRGIIFGKVYLTQRDSVGADSSRAPVRDSVGVPGVRIFLEDGTSVVTDLEGKFNLYGIVSGLHVVKVDPTTLPGGARLIDIDSRNARDGTSRFVDLKNGELHKADFAIRFVDSVGATVGFRRDRGEITGVIVDSLAGTDRGGQDRPVVAVDAASDTAQAPAYRPLSAQSSANPIDEANRLPVSRLPGTTVPLTAIPNGSVELTPARRSLPADGNTAMAVRVKVLDRDRNLISSEQPITLEASLGRWLAQDLDPVEPGVQAMLANGQGDFTLVASSEAGVGEIRVTNGLRISTAQIVFLPATRPMLVNGLVEARIDLRSLLKNGLTQVTAADRFERELKDLRTTSDDGRFTAAARGALFLQGKVKGSTLLTLAYDTEGDPERRMFRDIQPDEFYPVYGDASIKEFGAQSFDRLYVRVDADRSFALYGDYITPSAGNGALAARELGAYQRSLTGALGHAEGRVGQLNIFASRDRLSQVVEEIPGGGISGPYQLRRSDGRINSEKVEILTRDRNQPSRIVASVQLSRFTDYTLEPFTGRLLFFAPVPSVDADLNPMSIRVLYEVERAGEEFWVYGADGQVKLGDRAEIGGGIVRDEQPLSNRKLYSANAAVQVAPGTVLVAEVAHTDGDSASFRGGAARFELRHASAKFQGTVFGATSDSGFSNQSSTFQRGRSELGIRGSAVLDERTRFIGEALRSDDKVSGRRRDGFLASFERQFGKSVRAELGYRFGRDSLNETNALRTRVTVQVPGQPRASVFGEFEQDLKASDQRRGALGGQYVLFDRLRLYGRHEFLSSFAGPFALNGSQRQATTVIGLDAGYTKDGQFFGEYRASDAFSGRQTEAAIGLRNRWNLRRGLVLNTGFERVDVLKGVGQGEATAVTAGVEYTTSPLWRGTARVEYRFAPNAAGDNFLATLGYARKLDRDWTVLGRALYNTFGDGGKRTRNQVGFAWRETDRNRWNGLARWENRFERLAPSGGAGTVQKTNILSAHLNYQPLRSVWMSGRLAGKWATDESNGLVSSNRAVLGSVRALYDFLPSWDAGLIGSMLSSNGRQYGTGVELGRTVVTNMRMAVGYNVFGFKNQDLTSDGATTDRGFYLHFGFKFSEDLFKRQQ